MISPSARRRREVLAVNLKRPFIYIQEVLPTLCRRGGGSIVNISSVSGQYSGPRTAYYAASEVRGFAKAGLISLGQVQQLHHRADDQRQRRAVFLSADLPGLRDGEVWREEQVVR